MMFTVKPHVQDLSRGSNVQMICQGDFPIAGGCTLTYLGFSDRGQLIAQDSNGLLQGLHRQRSPRSMLAYWTPLMHTDRMWTIGVSKGRVMGVVCKGDQAFPSTLPKPVPTATKMILPLIQTSSASGQLEENVVRLAMELSQRSFREGSDHALNVASEADEKKLKIETITEIDKSNLRLMMTACKKDKSARALDLAARLFHRKSIEIAIKLAEKQNLLELAQRLDILRRAHDCVASDEEEVRKKIHAFIHLLLHLIHIHIYIYLF